MTRWVVVSGIPIIIRVIAGVFVFVILGVSVESIAAILIMTIAIPFSMGWHDAAKRDLNGGM